MVYSTWLFAWALPFQVAGCLMHRFSPSWGNVQDVCHLLGDPIEYPVTRLFHNFKMNIHTMKRTSKWIRATFSYKRVLSSVSLSSSPSHPPSSLSYPQFPTFTFLHSLIYRFDFPSLLIKQSFKMYSFNASGLLALGVSLLSLPALINAVEYIDYNGVQPFSESYNSAAIKKFQPTLSVTAGCVPYPAVNAAGQLS